MTRFLHTADWQLGMTRHFLSAEAQARFTAARLDVVRAIGALAVAEGAAFVVVCGDVFETNAVERQVVVRALEAMKATPEVTFYLLPGNHDPLDAGSVFRSPTFTAHQPANVVVLHGAEPVGLAGDPAVEIVPAPWSTKRPITDLVGAAVGRLAHAARGARIVVGHGAVDVLSPDPTHPATIHLAPLEGALAEGVVHYVALGDRHSATAVGSSGRIWYSGAPEPTDYDEVAAGRVLVVEVAPGAGPGGMAVTVEERTVGMWRFVLEHRELTGAEDLAGLETFLAGLPDKSRSIVKLALVGQLSLQHKVRLDELLEHHADLLAALETWERHTDLVVLPDDDDFDDLGLSGFGAQALDDLRRQAALSTPESHAARDALGLLYRLGRRAS